MKKTAVHQFHSGSDYGDAVTNSMRLIRSLLREFGFESNIYVERVAPQLKNELLSHKKLKPGKNDIILVHHSMGHGLGKWVRRLEGRKILVYHNITPARFFSDSCVYRHYSSVGRKQLTEFMPVMDAAICVSKLNEDELREVGYRDVTEIPLLVDVADIQNRPWDESPVTESTGKFTLLYVGRIAPNKCQEDLIPVAGILKRMLNRPFQLVLVGGFNKIDVYYRKLSGYIKSAGLEGCVKLTGKVSDDRLYGWYRAADLFVSMSEHEGFGVPLIEAMAFDLPVLAYSAGNIPHTMGGAGVLFTRKEHAAIAAFIKLLSSDRALKRALVSRQRDHIQKFTRQNMLAQLAAFFKKQNIDIPNPDIAPDSPPAFLRYQVEGPFETSYSLALVNRGMALALDRELGRKSDRGIENRGGVGLFATEGPGDYTPEPSAVKAHPGVEALWSKGKKGSRAEVVIRNLYPPRVADMDGQINLLYYAWEESAFPFDWIRQFNENLDGMPVVSNFVKKVLIDNGLSLPVRAVGDGVDHICETPEHYPLKSGAAFKFLHISSCFPRKGVDLLLDAFAKTFTAKDNTALVIKTFPNIHNAVEDQVDALKTRFPHCPDIEIINEDLSMARIAGLYTQCDALVAPSRGEGFGLPMAEAMLYGLPVITTAYGGQSDFCTEETCWPVDFSFEPAQTHMGLFNSVWAEPDGDHLGRRMKEVRYAGKKQLQPKLDAAKALIEKEFTWDRCAQRLMAFEADIRSIPPLSKKKIRLGWISSWNTKCGIATYSKCLVDAIDPDAFEVNIFAPETSNTIIPDTDTLSHTASIHRCWISCGGEVDGLLATMAQENLHALVLQFSFAFFRADHLEQIIRFANDREIVLVFMFHATRDVQDGKWKASLAPVTESLKRVDRLLVHGVDDLNLFKQRGLYENTALFPHGVLNRMPVATAPGDKVVIASYGFMLPHKGLEQLIRAFAVLREKRPDLHLLMVNALYPDPISTETKIRCQQLIEAHRLAESVTMETRFLTDEQSYALLDTASMVVFPYQATAESSSAAARYGLASRNPVVCTPLEIFSNIRPFVHTLPGTAPEDIAAGINRLLNDPDLLKSKKERQEEWLAANNWDVLGERLGGMIAGLVRYSSGPAPPLISNRPTSEHS
ncbi:MAG: glycosyltransferase [Desulfobacter postgatei]|uniref:glycosyltransferase family 4 protein n=1 Tax=Desulfobacter postgatei TaxID=2293 RepID=UPI0023F3DE6E|nr:glycosyltransferase [Desulfobacter postgatei]MDD4273480.1 glycosyltransferase [Desulfobacter postgatei]